LDNNLQYSNMKFYSLIFSFFIFFISCNTKKDIGANEETALNNEPNSKYNLEQNKYLKFRRNYFYDDNIKNNPRLMKSFMERNPERTNTTDTLEKVYDKGFKELNLLDSIGNFNLATWKKLTTKETSQINIDGNLLSIKTLLEGEGIRIQITDSKKLLVADKTFKLNFPVASNFFIFDIDTDNQDEIIVLDNWYIINGDNYDFTIIEINKN
jgi:hypothetical protein